MHNMAEKENREVELGELTMTGTSRRLRSSVRGEKETENEGSLRGPTSQTTVEDRSGENFWNVFLERSDESSLNAIGAVGAIGAI